jgi:circadian clock protein KaiC
MTSGVDAPQSQQRALPKAPTGITGLDEITGGGLPRGRPTLVCGGAGCGKTLLALEFLVRGATEFGEPGVCMSFEETAGELTQNVRSLGFDLADLVARKQLVLDFVRVERSEIEETGDYGLEGLFVRLGHAIDTIGAKRVVLDPVGNLSHAGSRQDTAEMLTRLIDFLKVSRITVFLTGVSPADSAQTGADLEISSLVDTWIHLRDIESNGERNRVMYILKSRGMAHSNQIREFRLTDQRIELVDVYLGPEGVLTGAARQSQEAREKSETLLRQQRIEAKQRELQRMREALEARITAMRKEFDAEEAELQQEMTQDRDRDDVSQQDRMRMRAKRQADDGLASVDSARSRKNARVRK